MFCENCGTELPDGAVFCSNCGKRIKVKAKNNNKNIYIAMILTFFITGLGSVYAGNAKKGLILFIVRILFAIIGLFISLFIFKMQEYHNFCKLWMNCTMGCTVFFN